MGVLSLGLGLVAFLGGRAVRRDRRAVRRHRRSRHAASLAGVDVRAHPGDRDVCREHRRPSRWAALHRSADSQLIGGVAGIGALTTFSTFVAELFEIHQIDRGWAWRYGARPSCSAWPQPGSD